MRNLGKWMTAVQHPLIAGWVIRAKTGDVLGIVAWFPRWRQFEFEPRDGAAFSWDCLKALSEFLVELNEEKRAAKESTA